MDTSKEAASKEAVEKRGRTVDAARTIPKDERRGDEHQEGGTTGRTLGTSEGDQEAR